MAGNRKVTVATCSAFLSRNKLTQSNTHTNGESLQLFGNTIAEWRGNELWVTDAGWDTSTTRERLNGLGCSVYRQKGDLYLNGKKWDGNWIQIDPRDGSTVHKPTGEVAGYCNPQFTIA